MKPELSATTVKREAKWLAAFRTSSFKDTFRKWVMVILLLLLAWATFV